VVTHSSEDLYAMTKGLSRLEQNSQGPSRSHKATPGLTFDVYEDKNSVGRDCPGCGKELACEGASIERGGFASASRVGSFGVAQKE
jgi:hypothetical protein